MATTTDGTMAKNGTLSSFKFTDSATLSNGVANDMNIKHVHILELRNAVNKLEGYIAKVDNCGNCTFCQSCQSCQSQTCQSQCA